MKKNSIILILVAVIGICFSGWAAYLSSRAEQSTIYSEFKNNVNSHVDRIELGLQLALENLRSIKGLYDAIHLIDRKEFRTFVSNMLQQNKSIQALEWIPRIPRDKLDAYEAQARNEGLAGYQIMERLEQGQMVRVSERSEYFPIYFLEPLTGNEAALGFDLASSKKRKLAIDKARDEGIMVATASVTLVQETSKQKGFLVFEPIYRGSNSTISERRASLIGFTLGVFRIGDIVEKAISDMDDKRFSIHMELRDETNDNELLTVIYQIPAALL